MSCLVNWYPVHADLNCLAPCSRAACVLLRTLANHFHGFRSPWMAWPHCTAVWCSHHLDIFGLGQAYMCPACSYPSGRCFCTRQSSCHSWGTLSANMAEVTFDAAYLLFNLAKVIRWGFVTFFGLDEHLSMAHANVKQTCLGQYQCCSYTTALHYKLHSYSWLQSASRLS